MSKNTRPAEAGTPYTFYGKIPLKQAIPLGLQHVMAMFVGNLTPLIIVMGACGLTTDSGFGDLRTALLQGKRVVLVDDVMTSGASLFSAAQALRQAGAGSVMGLVFARTE